MVRRTDVISAVDELGLGDHPVALHTSLSAHGLVEGGAASIVDALLDRGVTLVVPTFSSVFEVWPPPPGTRIERNGIEGADLEPRTPSEVFTPESTAIDRSMGAVPREVLARPGRRRGRHPLDSFTALGPLADELVAGQTVTDVYAPLRAVGDHGGMVVLAGVGLNRMTLLHHAETRAGRTLFRRWARAPGGEVVTTLVGGCSEGFPNLDPVLEPIERSVRVGSARWRTFPVAGVVDIASAAIRADPAITRCDSAGCTRCPDAIAGGPVGRRPGPGPD